MNQPDKNHPPDNPKKPAISPLSLLQSVCAAAFGVQSEANRQRDFESGKFWHFIIAGILFVLAFAGLVWAGVQLLLATA